MSGYLEHSKHFKYIRKYRKNGKWRYVYATNEQHKALAEEYKKINDAEDDQTIYKEFQDESINEYSRINANSILKNTNLLDIAKNNYQNASKKLSNASQQIASSEKTISDVLSNDDYIHMGSEYIEIYKKKYPWMSYD